MSDLSPQNSKSNENEGIIYSIHVPLIIEASAGSGKTTILVKRYIAVLIYLLAVEKRSAFEAVKEIVALTFTRKAAGEMKDRIRRIIEEKFSLSYLMEALSNLETYNKIRITGHESVCAEILMQKESLQSALSSASISTIHSFGLNILRSHPVETELDPSASPQDNTGTADMGMTAKDAFFKTIRKLIDSRNKDFSLLIQVLGYESCEKILMDLMKTADSYGMDVLHDIIKRSRYLEYETENSIDEWMEKKAKPVLKKIPEALNGIKESIRKNALPAVEETIGKIEKALELSQASDLFHADVYYDKGSKVVKEAVEDLYGSYALELHKPLFSFLWRAFKIIYDSYEVLKRERKEISFSDIENKLLSSFNNNGDLVADVKKSIRYLLIDEFQDTSDIQKEIFDRLIYNEKRELSLIPFIVGDPKQSIYGFRNANIEIFENTKNAFKEYQGRYPSATYIELDKNYRSDGNLVAGFNRIFEDIFKDGNIAYHIQTAGRENGPKERGVFFVPARGGKTDEIVRNSCRDAACLIAELVNSGSYKPMDIMVLIRKGTKLSLLRESFEEILGAQGIPYFNIDSSNILEAPEIQDIIIYLQALENPSSNFYFLPLLKTPFFRKTDPEIAELLRNNPSLYEALNGTNDPEMEIFNDIRRKKNRVNIADLAEEIIGRSGYFSFLTTLPHKKEASTNAVVFLDYLRRLQTSEMFNLTDFLYYLQEYGITLAKPQVIGEKSNVVKVMTVHSSKGLESRAVIYIATSGGGNRSSEIIVSRGGRDRYLGMNIFCPDRNYTRLAEFKKGSEAEEEKRLAYVTFTRAEELFYYIGADNLAERNEKGKIDRDERDGKDGWGNFINLKKEFVSGRMIKVPEIKSRVKSENNIDLLRKKVSDKYELLKKNEEKLKYASFPLFVTITQLLDIEFLEAAFKKRYIDKSFPVDEALNEIAHSDDVFQENARADEGTFLHRVFQYSDDSSYPEYIEQNIEYESGVQPLKKDSIIKKAEAFFTSAFYQKYYSSANRSYSEWELNYPFEYSGFSILIKGAIDRYILLEPDYGVIVDYKLKVHSGMDRYARQLNYYAFILTELGYQVRELYLYDIEEGLAISVEKNTSDIKKIITQNLTRMKQYFLPAIF